MLIQENPNHRGNYIQKRLAHGFVISGMEYNYAVIVNKEKVREWRHDIYAPDALTAIIAYQPELVIFGTGINQIFPPPAILDILSGEKMHFEIMNTNSACGTYNILLAEERNVVAALMPHREIKP